MRVPKLIPLDMGRADESKHPDIDARKTYLCLIDGEFFAGRFSRQWFGWNFDGWRYNDCGLQFDAPGTNGSKWQRIWEIRKRK